MNDKAQIESDEARLDERSEEADTRCYRPVNHPEITPGPWAWFCNERTKSIYLATPNRGRLYVMGFERYGMNRAAPSFCNNDGEPRIIKRADRWGTKPDHNGYFDIDNPDARLIAAAPDLYAIVKELIDNYSGLCGIKNDFKDRAKIALNKVAGIDND